MSTSEMIRMNNPKKRKKMSTAAISEDEASASNDDGLILESSASDEWFMFYGQAVSVVKAAGMLSCLPVESSHQYPALGKGAEAAQAVALSLQTEESALAFCVPAREAA